MTLTQTCEACGESRAFEDATGDRSGLCAREGCRQRRAERARARGERDERAEILDARAVHPISGACRFELARQDGREYFRLLCNERGAGSLTTQKHAIATVKWWRLKGWAA